MVISIILKFIIFVFENLDVLCHSKFISIDINNINSDNNKISTGKSISIKQILS